MHSIPSFTDSGTPFTRALIAREPALPHNGEAMYAFTLPRAPWRGWRQRERGVDGYFVTKMPQNMRKNSTAAATTQTS
jgi:hypothetical protein